MNEQESTEHSRRHSSPRRMIVAGFLSLLGLAVGWVGASGAFHSDIPSYTRDQSFHGGTLEWAAVPPSIHARFAIRNVSDHPLSVAGKQVSCGCTSVTVEPATLQPGDSGVIKAVMDLQAPGERRSTIVIEWSDETTTQYTVAASSVKMNQLKPSFRSVVLNHNQETSLVVQMILQPQSGIAPPLQLKSDSSIQATVSQWRKITESESSSLVPIRYTATVTLTPAESATPGRHRLLLSATGVGEEYVTAVIR